MSRDALMNRIHATTVKLARADGAVSELPADWFRPEGKLLNDEIAYRGVKFRLIAHETDAIRYLEIPANGAACGKKVECGSNCWLPREHSGACLCASDEDGEPGTCPA